MEKQETIKQSVQSGQTAPPRADTQYQTDMQHLKAMRPIDDEFMRGLFKDNLPLAQFVLRILTRKPDLILLSSETQKDMKRVTGTRSICLDVYGTDDTGKRYDLEIQRADKGADEHRARYHSSVMDVENLHAGQDFKELPDTYIIFIIENDFFEQGAPFYLIHDMNLTTEKPFADGRYILYINGTYRGDDDIGKLMHDFNCTNADDMHFSLMAERTRYLKETQKGVRSMSKLMDDWRKEIAHDERVRIVKEMIADGNISFERIAKISNLPLAEIQQLAGTKTA